MHPYISGEFLALIAAALIASMKNRSVLGWLILALFFSWFAVLIVACLRPLRRY